MISLPSSVKIIKKQENQATFEIDGLYPGYGTTIGNGLRRVLLSSLPGAAITQVKIKGVPHEFSVIPGVIEDVVMIILNLKSIRFRSFTDEPQMISLSVKGEKEVKAKDFKIPANLELITPDIHIATLTKASAELEIEAKVETGVGYEPVEMREIKKAEVGVIPVDAIFTPIKRVSFSVGNVRVGNRTDFDKLLLEIETDGSLSPEDAFSMASEIFIEHFKIFLNAFKPEEEAAEKEALTEEEKKDNQIEEEEKKEEKKENELAEEEVENKKIKIEDLKVGNRTKNALLENGIKTVGGLLRKNKEDLLNLEGLGKKGVEEIEKALKKLKLELKQ